ncbi:MAG: hypothetical protein SF051_13300, partial [Elusimicrobiota bacterium]|nr:hypothetical protein [Elusimicrobiota bacterium]
DVALLVCDATGPLDEAEALLARARRLRGDAPVVRVWSKTDLAGARPAGGVPVSSVTGDGLDALAAAVATACAGRDDEEAPACGARQAAALRAALDALDGARADAGSPELLSSRLREAVGRLGAVLGEDASPDALDAVFSRFCLGK